MGQLKQAIYGIKKPSKMIKEELGLQPSAAATVAAVPSTTLFVVVRMSQDGIGAPVGVYSDSSKADAARDIVEPAQTYELVLDADPEEN